MFFSFGNYYLPEIIFLKVQMIGCQLYWNFIIFFNSVSISYFTLEGNLDWIQNNHWALNMLLNYKL